MITSIFFDILSSIKQHKARSFLTGFGIGWGIFILVILLGTSAGTQKGVMTMLEGFAQNSIWFYGGLAKDHDGQRKIVFDETLLQQIAGLFQEHLIEITPEINLSHHTHISYQQTSQHFSVKAVRENYFDIKLLKVSSGRLFNEYDNKKARNIAIVGEKVKEILFDHKDPIGKDICISEEFFKVVGILESGSVFDQLEQGTIFIPLRTAIKNFNISNDFSVFGLSLAPDSDVSLVESRIKHFLAQQLLFDSKDKKALYIFNFEQQSSMFLKLFEGLNQFFWFIGICLLLSGVIGVTNIMFVVVKERTKEIGIRKAIGAKPQNILTMILFESISITVFAGFLGILVGVLGLELINLYLQSLDILIKNTFIDFRVVIGALVILVVSGLVAGLVPANNAMKIKTIKAIQTE